MPIVVIVGKYGHADAIQACKPGLPGYVFECAIAPVAIELRFHSIRDKQVVESVIVIINCRDAARAIADHAKSQRLSQEGWIILVLKIYSSLMRHVDEVRPVRINAFAFNQLARAELQGATTTLP